MNEETFNHISRLRRTAKQLEQSPRQKAQMEARRCREEAANLARAAKKEN